MLNFSTNETYYNSTREPREIASFLPIAILCCASVGIPLNLLIASVIILQRRLHKPRHIFWLGVTFSNLFALLASLAEFAVFYSAPGNQIMCWIFIVLVGIPYGTLLLNLLLGLLDRYAAITYPLWHKNWVTVKRIVSAQLAGLAVITISFKIPYMVEGNLNELDCEDHQPHGKIIVLSLMSLVALCIVFQVIIYYRARVHFFNQREGHCRPESIPSRTIMGRRNNPPSGIDETTLSSPPNGAARHEPESSFFVHVGSETISRLEIEAAWTLLAGVSSLCLFASPHLLCPARCLLLQSDLRRLPLRDVDDPLFPRARTRAHRLQPHYLHLAEPRIHVGARSQVFQRVLVSPSLAEVKNVSSCEQRPILHASPAEHVSAPSSRNETEMTTLHGGNRFDLRESNGKVPLRMLFIA